VVQDLTTELPYIKKHIDEWETQTSEKEPQVMSKKAWASL